MQSVITTNDIQTFNTHKGLASNGKETISIGEKTTYDDIQANVKRNNCNEETVINIDNNNTVLQVNIDNKLLQKTHTGTSKQKR